ncbi:2906_t:CDS:2 [Ambispora leptoticha]|uniref:2906_t:CDS:1 n=1 Tax=Ambispora leptoticha TaxID=144679 RepID=A0A9N8YRW9_9GLOM|nr:2906_t:CDS:2 [Ambispora leptoticha]
MSQTANKDAQPLVQNHIGTNDLEVVKTEELRVRVFIQPEAHTSIT